MIFDKFELKFAQNYISTNEFNTLVQITKILNIFEAPTIKLQGPNYPTLYYSLPYYLQFEKALGEQLDQDIDFSSENAIHSSLFKLINI